nr:MAG TPA: hypothetical protein [Crassvirales sp.]
MCFKVFRSCKREIIFFCFTVFKCFLFYKFYSLFLSYRT